jgi:hypothetical protein
MVMTWFFFDVAVVMIAIKAAEWKLRIDFIFGFDQFRIVTCSCYQFVDFFLGDLMVIIDNLQIFCFSVPARELDSCMIERRFNPVLAHDTVAKHLDVRFTSLGLSVNRGSSEHEEAYNINEFRFHGDLI